VHAMGMCEDVLHAIERRAQGRRVAAIGVRAGTMLRVVPEAFRQSFELVSGGTVAHEAEVDVTIVPAAARCQACDETFDASDPYPACPSCGSVEVEVSGGDELTLEWLRYAQTTSVASDVGGG
jgi:hydrogenase nickel incorporation protein HypA/HybF